MVPGTQCITLVYPIFYDHTLLLNLYCVLIIDIFVQFSVESKAFYKIGTVNIFQYRFFLKYILLFNKEIKVYLLIYFVMALFVIS